MKEERKKENSTELQKPNVEVAVYKNNKKPINIDDKDRMYKHIRMQRKGQN